MPTLATQPTRFLVCSHAAALGRGPGGAGQTNREAGKRTGGRMRRHGSRGWFCGEHPLSSSLFELFENTAWGDGGSHPASLGELRRTGTETRPSAGSGQGFVGHGGPGVEVAEAVLDQSPRFLNFALEVCQYQRARRNSSTVNEYRSQPFVTAWAKGHALCASKIRMTSCGFKTGIFPISKRKSAACRQIRLREWAHPLPQAFPEPPVSSTSARPKSHPVSARRETREYIPHKARS